MLRDLLEAHEFLVLDGALATELERRGHDLEDSLWSARVLHQEPDAIRAVHADYLEAGADILTTASYQATFQQFGERGLDRDAVGELLGRSVQLAVEARETARIGKEEGFIEPLVAASIGPYGAYLHDGSEYRGDYDLGVDELAAFHRERFGYLATAGADLLALETVPCLSEVRSYDILLREFPGVEAWLSFSCRDGEHLSSGESIREAVELANGMESLAAVGVNCVGPQWIDEIVQVVNEVTAKPIIVYPNAGDRWDPTSRRWETGSGPRMDRDLCRRWVDAGVRILGGCCRTGPDFVRNVASLRHP